MLFTTREDYRRLWDGLPDALSLPPATHRCKHLGEPTGDLKLCPSCKGSVSLKVFGCFHPDHGNVTLRDCLACPDNTHKPVNQRVMKVVPAPLTCNEKQTADEMLVVVRSNPPGPWPEGWRNWQNVAAAHKVLLAEKLAGLDAERQEPGEGRGIIIGAGGLKYFICAWVAVTILRKLGCTLPIQFWHLGPLEMDPGMRQLAATLGVECVDAREVEAKHQTRILAGWELKPFAVQHCRFREVMYVDSDNVPARDPTHLFDEPAYKAAGAMFWPDLPPNGGGEWVSGPAWEAFAIPDKQRSLKVRAFESGQFIINKARCGRELSLAMWVNEHSDYYYGLLYGDKDTFLMAWEKLASVEGRQASYCIPSRPAGWICNGAAGAITQHDMRGDLIFQHRCRPYPDKWSLTRDNLRIKGFMHEQDCFDALEALKVAWPGQTLWHNFAPTVEETCFSRQLVGKRFRYDRVGFGSPRTLEFLGGSGAGGRIGKGAEEYERRWEVFIRDGRTTLAVCHNNKPTCLLRQAPDDTWRGNWLEHEKMPVTLTELA